MAAAQQLRELAGQYLSHGLLPVPAWAATPGGCRCPRGRQCPRPGKHPRAIHAGPGPADYSWKPLTCRTQDQIRQRFADDGPYATANLMLAIPPAMMVIDQDDDDGGRQAASRLAAALGELPPTLGHQTPHGTHKIFATPPGWTGRAWVGKAAGNPLPPGIDLRMPGQVLLAPPSRVPGRHRMAGYGPVTGTDVALLPGAYLAAWPAPQRRQAPQVRRGPVPPEGIGRLAAYLHTSMERIAADLAARPPGGRNEAIYTAALKTGSLLGAVRATPGGEVTADLWPDEAAEDELLASCAANGYLDKLGGTAMARATIRSGLRNGLRNPRVLPDFTTPSAAPDGLRVEPHTAPVRSPGRDTAPQPASRPGCRQVTPRASGPGLSRPAADPGRCIQAEPGK